MRRPIGVLAVAALLTLVAPPIPAAPEAPEWTVAFDDDVPGDLVLVGNTVTACPAAATACRAAEDTGSGALNNDHPMVWVDTDDDPRTVTSSSAALDIPAGARIVHATLSWAGTLPDGSGPCARTGTWPPGSPASVVLSVAGAAAPLSAPVTAGAAPPRSDRWYSAHADVTDRFAATTGPVALTVGGVWTGRGHDCAGGWSMSAVWSHDGAPRHRVVVHTGHASVGSGPAHVLLHPPGLRIAGGTPRLGVVALEGDQGIGGDALVVNGSPRPEPTGTGSQDNFFVAGATGARAPAHRNNMSVDAKTVELTGVRPGVTSVDVVATAGPDHYLLHVLALSVPLPGIALVTDVDRPVAHAGEAITQRAVVTNTGGVPLHGTSVTFGLDPACAKDVGPLGPGEHAEVACTGPAVTGALTASAAATDPAGGALTATATTTTRVIRPALALRIGTPHDVVLAGEVVTHRVVVTNSGDAALSSVRLAGLGCAGEVAATLIPGSSATTDCLTPATTAPVTATALDELGAPVTATTGVPYRIVRADLDIDVTVPPGPIAPGDVVTLTVRVRNTGDVTLTDLVVTGEPAECGRPLPDLAPGAATVYTCRLVVDGPVTVALVVSGTPALPGRPTGAVAAVHRTTTVAVAPGNPLPDIASRAPEPATPAPARVPAPASVPEHELADGGPLRSPLTPAVIAVLGVLVMTVSLGGLSSAARRVR
ncbi:hypothetical protein [Actinophytocola algeriensis]|uniref:Repeat protein (TIGR01451 family) n=1 Tax=Actinophytocola algeriensis TaxID=1768010 RepID=A0A7W7VJ81_9PSEU|nr:hypothetical protein [Actinophytocola algeriensis]MBB4912271.1 hypothetical protein [Actinophytocola algeriensis]MBE1474213.1 hypothetical protein [Actinophytocola algeriensis]